jgi:hypothetical protein
LLQKSYSSVASKSGELFRKLHICIFNINFFVITFYIFHG